MEDRKPSTSLVGDQRIANLFPTFFKNERWEGSITTVHRSSKKGDHCEPDNLLPVKWKYFVDVSKVGNNRFLDFLEGQIGAGHSDAA